MDPIIADSPEMHRLPSLPMPHQPLAMGRRLAPLEVDDGLTMWTLGLPPLHFYTKQRTLISKLQPARRPVSLDNALNTALLLASRPRAPGTSNPSMLY